MFDNRTIEILMKRESLKKQQSDLLRSMQDYVLHNEGWSKKDANFAQANLNLYDVRAVQGMNSEHCFRILNVLKNLKYEKSTSFTSLWEQPPTGYTLAGWKIKYGKEPKISTAKANLLTLQLRICDYLRLPSEK